VIVIDTNVLIQLVSGAGSTDDDVRLRALIDTLSTARTYIGVPTPALAEFLVRTDAATEGVLRTMEKSAALRVLPFDKKAAYECAQIDRAMIAVGTKRGRDNLQPWQKVKIDRQIVAIAKSNGATQIISADSGVISTAVAAGMTALRISDLPLPPSARQQPLFEDYGVASHSALPDTATATESEAASRDTATAANAGVADDDR
jgi:predicted nucleic acid-binding protein